MSADTRLQDGTWLSKVDFFLWYDDGSVIDFEFVDLNEAACLRLGGDRSALLGRRLLEVDPHRKATGLFAACVAEAVESPVLARLAESDLYWDPVVAIEPDGVEEVFDLTVEGLHSFVADEWGDLVAEFGAEEAGVLTATLDLSAAARHRAGMGFFRDRRPQLYTRICQDV